MVSDSDRATSVRLRRPRNPSKGRLPILARSRHSIHFHTGFVLTTSAHQDRSHPPCCFARLCHLDQGRRTAHGTENERSNRPSSPQPSAPVGEPPVRVSRERQSSPPPQESWNRPCPPPSSSACAYRLIGFPSIETHSTARHSHSFEYTILRFLVPRSLVLLSLRHEVHRYQNRKGVLQSN